MDDVNVENNKITNIKFLATLVWIGDVRIGKEQSACEAKGDDGGLTHV